MRIIYSTLLSSDLWQGYRGHHNKAVLENIQPINYRPVEISPTTSEIEDHRDMKQPMLIQQKEDILNHTSQQNSIFQQETTSNSPTDIQRIIAENVEALVAAINALKKARSNLKNLLPSK